MYLWRCNLAAILKSLVILKMLFALSRSPTALSSLRMMGTADDWRHHAFELMAARQWNVVEDALAAAVCGKVPLPGDDGPPLYWQPQSAEETKPKKRVTWMCTIAYSGPAFSGFAWQPDPPKPTVQGCLQDALLPLLDGKSALRISCAGRTDAGVSALGQEVSFHSWPQLTASAIHDALAAASPEPGALRLVRARRVDPSYHATFSTAWRRYAYLLPASAGQTRADVVDEAARIDRALRPMVGVTRDYAALGRAVPTGKATAMMLRLARARVVELPPPAVDETGADAGGAYAAGGGDAAASGDDATRVATRVDIVGDRFLRRQVRCLVATAVAAASGLMPPEVHQAVADGLVAEGGAEKDEAELLLRAICTSCEQDLTAHPAPALGLVFAAAGGE